MTWNEAQEGMPIEAEKALNEFLDDQSGRLAEQFATQIADYMMAPSTQLRRRTESKSSGAVEDLSREAGRAHPFLKTWFQGQTDAE